MTDNEKKICFENGTLSNSELDDYSNLGDYEFNDFDNTFELPLKNLTSARESNFSDLPDDWSSFPGTPSLSFSKKVRFGMSTSDNSNTNIYKEMDISNKEDYSLNVNQNESTASNAKSRVNVEELIKSANEVNDYLADHIDNINSFRSELLSNKSFYRLMSDIPTNPGTRNGSTSNFLLSDYDDDDHESSNIVYNEERPHSRLSHEISAKSTDDNNVQLELEANIIKFSNLKMIPHNDQNYESEPLGHIGDYIAITPNAVLDPTNLILGDTAKAISNLKETIELMLRLSQEDIALFNKNNKNYVDNEAFGKFVMKNAPSLPYQDFIDRIQEKCHYDDVVYLAATYLLQVLLLTKDPNQDKLRLQYPISNKGIHRLIISTVRISTKLLEDHVHSHDYFSKVCGISRKLLTRLEIALLTCLKKERLTITHKKLVAGKEILNELRQLT